jgi:hypothetical protein
MFYLPEFLSDMSMMRLLQQMSQRWLRTERKTDYGERERERGNEDFEKVYRETSP